MHKKITAANAALLFFIAKKLLESATSALNRYGLSLSPSADLGDFCPPTKAGLHYQIFINKIFTMPLMQVLINL